MKLTTELIIIKKIFMKIVKKLLKNMLSLRSSFS